MEWLTTPWENMPQMVAFTLIAAILLVGDIITVRTKSWVPSVFVCAVLFLIGYWTFFPKEIVAISGIPAPVAVLFMYLLIVNMGTLLSVKELMAQWKTVIISLSGIAGVMALLFTVGMLFIDKQTALVSAPPLVGGLVSSLVMSQAAADAGLVSLSVLAILIYVMQGFAGYPITSIMLKREGKRVLDLHRAGQWQANATTEAEAVAVSEKPKMFAMMPDAYHTIYFKLFRIAIVGLAAWWVAGLLAPIVTIHPLVLALLFGVIAKSAGFLERQPLNAANSFGIAIMALMIFIFGGLNRASPDMLMELAVPMLIVIALGVVGMGIFSFIAGKILKVSPCLAFACSLTSFYGFPADYVITKEVIDGLTEDEAERDVLTSYMLPPMLVAGFVTVTITSVIIAGIFAGML